MHHETRNGGSFRASRAARATTFAAALLLAACGGGEEAGDAAAMQGGGATIEAPGSEHLIGLWEEGSAAFGIFVPSEGPARDEAGNRLPPSYTAEGGQRLGRNELLDYLFLNLEGAYDPEAVRAMVEGVATAGGAHRPALLVRIPTIEDAGIEATRARVAEVLRMGADGVVIPHVRSVEEARTAASFFEEAGADVWSPDNPDGSVIAMLMVEDGEAVAVADQIVAIPGYSMLSCGIGSLTRAIGGDSAAAEASCEEVLRLGAEAGMPSMMTAGENNLQHRVEQGYLGLLFSGSVEQAEALIRTGRELAGRAQ